jgi:peptidoglycan hydrolase CwlO-like protein
MSTTGAPAADDHGGSGDRLGSEPNDQEIVNQRNTSSDKLFQLAQAASDSIIQIPADVLTSLLHTLGGLQSSITTLHNTVTDLKSSIIELKKENRGLQQIISSVDKNVQLLKHNSGEFYLFAKLPLEIQR